VPGDEQHPLLIARIDSERERHARKDDDVFHRDQEKATHKGFFAFARYLPEISQE
jgi:hypothetical protein